jgi:hypothetical protein
MDPLSKFILEEKIFTKISPKYFESNFDNLKDFIKGLPEKTDEKYFDNEEKKYLEILNVVDVKLGNTIKTHNKKFGKLPFLFKVLGMSLVNELGNDLNSTLILCKDSRRNVQNTQKTLSINSLSILSKKRNVENLKV